MPYKLTRVTLIAMMLYAAGARSADDDASMFVFRGFGTLGTVHSSEDQADFVNSRAQPNGAGYWHRWAASVDSKLGVQMDVRVNDKLSGVVQVVSQYHHDSSYTPQIEWANLAWHISPDFTVRGGRFATSTFMFSETGLVGYVYPWIRPPVEVYTSLPLSNKDGIDAHYRFALGAATDTLQVSYGRTVKQLPGNTEVTADHYLDLHNSMDIGPATFRIGYTSFDLKVDGPFVAPLVGGYTQFGNSASLAGFATAGQQALYIANNFLKSRYSIATIGANYDPGNWLLMAEWEYFSYKTQVSKVDSSAWYVTGGYRIAEFTPYLTFARTKLDKKRIDGIPTTGLPSSLAAGAAGLNAALDTLTSRGSPGQDSVSLGMRWDIKTNVALKMQYDLLRTAAGTSGRLINAQPGFQPGGRVNLFSAAVDFVF